MRNITNQEFEVAINDIDNIRISKKAVSRFSNLDVEEKRGCFYRALYKAMQKWDSKLGKWTTYLYNYVTYECLNISKENSPCIRYKTDLNSKFDQDDFEDILKLADKKYYKLLKAKFLQNKSLRELGKMYNCTGENIRLKLKAALKQIKRKLI